MTTVIAELRLTGDEQAVRAAAAFLEEAFGEDLHLTKPHASTNPRYPGTWLSRGTLRAPTRSAKATPEAKEKT